MICTYIGLDAACDATHQHLHCVLCGMRLDDGSRMCRHHEAGADNWSKENRVWCSFFHRGEVIPRLHVEPLSDPAWESASFWTGLP